MILRLVEAIGNIADKPSAIGFSIQLFILITENLKYFEGANKYRVFFLMKMLVALCNLYTWQNLNQISRILDCVMREFVREIVNEKV